MSILLYDRLVTVMAKKILGTVGRALPADSSNSRELSGAPDAPYENFPEQFLMGRWRTRKL